MSIGQTIPLRIQVCLREITSFPKGKCNNCRLSSSRPNNDQHIFHIRLSISIFVVLSITSSCFSFFQFSTMKVKSLLYFRILSALGSFLSLMFSTIPLNWKKPLRRHIIVSVTTSSLLLVRSIVYFTIIVRLLIFLTT